MSSRKEKILYVVLIGIILSVGLSIAAFYFLFGSYANTTLDSRVFFLFLDVFFICAGGGLAYVLADEIYRE